MFYKVNKKVNIKHFNNKYTHFVILFITLFLISCTVTREKPSNYMDLANIDGITVGYRELESLIVVNISTQQLFLLIQLLPHRPLTNVDKEQIQHQVYYILLEVLAFHFLCQQQND